VVIDACTWDHPGADRYTGTVAAAIAAYRLPPATTKALIAAFASRRFDDTVTITKDAIKGEKHAYESSIHYMHFGSRGKVCKTVTRAKWTDKHSETAQVVCAHGECIAWPAVCGNVFRVRQLTPRAAPEPAARQAPTPEGEASGGGLQVPKAFAWPQLPQEPRDESAPVPHSALQLPNWTAPPLWAPYIVPPVATPKSAIYAPASPVSEPGSMLLAAAGLAMLALGMRK
jgi:hypothetical protein